VELCDLCDLCDLCGELVVVELGSFQTHARQVVN
jgi:hypothetical protein